MPNPQPQSRKKPTAVNIISGFLGTGKTTAIRKLLANKPEGEHWAVIVNEFGEIGVDGSILDQQEGCTVQELPGGCLCCSGQVSLQQALAQLLRRERPDRLLIEPSGLGHPAGVIDVLRSPYYEQFLQVNAMLVLVDPRQYVQQRYQDHPTYQDQLSLADVVVVNKLDLAEDEQVRQTVNGLAAMYPPKAAVGQTSQGRVDPNWLDLAPYPNRVAAHPHTHHAHGDDHDRRREEDAHADDPQGQHGFVGDVEMTIVQQAAQSKPALESEAAPAAELPPGVQEYCGEAEGYQTCGWLFSEDYIFDPRMLEAWFRALPKGVRAKGLFRIGRDWVLLQAADGAVTSSFLAYRRDSRVEVLAPTPGLKWSAWRDRLLATRLTVSEQSA